MSTGGDDDDDESYDEGDLSMLPQSTNKQPKKPETEEEKRRNFLERNRQGLSFVFSQYRTADPRS